MSVSVNSAQSTSYGSSSSDSGSKASVDYDSFLRLLVAEMKNQDPTNPMDSTQYVAQLASFSQVEQSVQINNKLDNLLQSSTLSQADALIGRTVTSADGKTTGEVVEVRLTSGGVVAVLDNGKTVDVGAGISITATKTDATSGTTSDETDGSTDTTDSGTDSSDGSTDTSDDGLDHDDNVVNEADALDIVQFAIWTVLTACGPAVAAAMLVGIVIALIQALTQVQEITLTFVPKIIAIMLVVAFTGPFIGSQISAFTNVIFERIETGF